MKYKGFEIYPVYALGSTFTIDDHGVVRDRNPTSKDIEYYTIYDPIDDRDWIKENTINECKATINAYLKKVGMKSNAQSEWDKLEG